MDTLLHDAFLRLDRAREHFESLKRESAAYVEANERFNLAKVEGHTVTAIRPTNLPPARLGVIVGEVAYNLRSALDYLVYQLAFIDSGKVVDGTQFPIVKKPEDFKRVRRKYLRGVKEAHIAAIEALQPYKRPHWLWLLRSLSNEDKHRALHLVGIHSAATRIRVGGTEEEAKALGGFRMAGDDVAMYFPVPLLVAFPDGTPVEETLEVLLAETRKVIEAFNPDFEGHPRTVTVTHKLAAIPIELDA